MSALPPKADIVQHDRDVRFVPGTATNSRLFDHLGQGLSRYVHWQISLILSRNVFPSADFKIRSKASAKSESCWWRRVIKRPTLASLVAASTLALSGMLATI
jgi:hypothetical protein